MWAALLGAAAQAACASELLGPQQDALDAARARWMAADLAGYVFEVQRFCFCGPDRIAPMRVEVKAGSVVSAVYAETGEPLPERIEPPTVGDLFDEIQVAIDQEAHLLEASYDDALGYPLDVSIDFAEEIVDEEMAFRVHSLEPDDDAEG